MDNSTDELGALGYNSSAPDLIERDIATPTEQAELPTLTRVQTVLQGEIARYKSIETLSLESGDLAVFSAESQIAINKEIVIKLQAIEALIRSTINKVKDLENERISR